MKRTTIPILPSEITPQQVYMDRRRLIAMGVAGAALAAREASRSWRRLLRAPTSRPLRNVAMSIADAPNSFEAITTYNNYYEFGTDKSDPAPMRAISSRTPGT